MTVQNPENAIVLADSDYRTAVYNAVELWAGATTSEGIRRHDLVRDKQQVITAFFDFIKKHPAENASST